MLRRLIDYIRLHRIFAEDLDNADHPRALYERAAGLVIAGRDVWTDCRITAGVISSYLQTRYGHSSHVVRHGAGWRITLDR